MTRLLYALSLLPRVVLVLLMVTLLADMFLGVIFRYVVGRALTWTEEVGTLSLVYLTFIGGAIGITRGAHFAIHVATERLSARAQRALSLVVALAIMGVGGLLVPTGWHLIRTNSSSETPALSLNLGVLYASTVIGGVLMICYAAALVVDIIRGRLPAPHPGPEVDEAAVAA
jgi:TRAP-type C4-dicarboxylate transport system permease small subunit